LDWLDPKVQTDYRQYEALKILKKIEKYSETFRVFAASNFVE
jgi:hypothetical protein